MWFSLGDLEFCMYFGANLYNKVIRGQRSSLYYYCLAVRMLFPFSSRLGNSQEHFTAIFHQESAFSCSYCLFLSLHIPMYTQRKTKCSNCSIFFNIGSRSRDKLLIIFYYMFGKQTMNWDLVTALIQKAYPFLLATEALLFNIKTNPLIVIIQIRLNFNRQLNCLLFCSTYLPSADLSLALEWYHSSPWQSVLFLHLLMTVSLSSLLKTIIIAQVFRKKNVPIGIWLCSAFFLDIFSQVCSYLMTPGNHKPCPTCAYQKNATASDGWLALVSAFGEGTHYFGVEELSYIVISGHFHWLWVRRLF